MQTNQLEIRFRQLLSNFVKKRDINERVHFLVACSGGADSLALWQLFLQNKKLYKELTVIHVWHNLRSEAADEYSDLLEQARNNDSRFLAFKVDVLTYSQRYQLSDEVAARELRRLAFAWATCYYTLKNEKNTCVYLALAQHLDDQAETVLAHCLKGTGLRGLAAIWPIKEHTLSFDKLKQVVQQGYLQIVDAPYGEREELLDLLDRGASSLRYTAWRPLLDFKKSDLLQYIESLHLSHAEDQSNHDTHYERNYLRQIILPNLNTRFPKASEKLADLASISQNQLQALDYLLQTSTNLTNSIHNLSNCVNLSPNDHAFAISIQTTGKLEIIPENVLTIYWQRLLANSMPDLMLNNRQQIAIAKFIKKADQQPSKNMQFLSLQKGILAVLLDSCLVIYQSTDFSFATKELDKKLIWQKCEPFFIEHYGRKFPLVTNWQRYFTLHGTVEDNWELRSARDTDYLLVNNKKQLNLYEYLDRLPIPKELYGQVMVLVLANSGHVQHIFYNKLEHNLFFQHIDERVD